MGTATSDAVCSENTARKITRAVTWQHVSSNGAAKTYEPNTDHSGCHLSSGVDYFRAMDFVIVTRPWTAGSGKDIGNFVQWFGRSAFPGSCSE